MGLLSERTAATGTQRRRDRWRVAGGRSAFTAKRSVNPRAHPTTFRKPGHSTTLDISKMSATNDIRKRNRLGHDHNEQTLPHTQRSLPRPVSCVTPFTCRLQHISSHKVSSELLPHGLRHRQDSVVPLPPPPLSTCDPPSPPLALPHTATGVRALPFSTTLERISCSPPRSSCRAAAKAVVDAAWRGGRDEAARRGRERRSAARTARRQPFQPVKHVHHCGGRWHAANRARRRSCDRASPSECRGARRSPCPTGRRSREAARSVRARRRARRGRGLRVDGAAGNYILTNIFNTMTRDGTIKELTNTKLGKFYSENPYFRDKIYLKLNSQT